MSRYQEDLKKIVGIKELENRLAALEEKQPIPGARAVSYDTLSGAQTATGDRSTGGVNGANETVLGALRGVNAALGALPGNLGSGASDAAAAALGDRFNVGGGGSFDQQDLWGNVAAGIIEAVDLFAINDNSGDISDVAGTTAAGSLNLVPSNLGRDFLNQYVGDRNIPQSRAGLAGITGLVDCATGEAFSIMTQEYIPPEDWLTADDDDVIDSTYVAGQLWYAVYGSAYVGQTFAQMIAATLTESDFSYAYNLDGGGGANLVTSVIPSAGGYILLSSSVGNVGDSAGSLGGAILSYSLTPGAAQTYGLKPCADLTADANAVVLCALPAPTAARWPTVAEGALYAGQILRNRATGLFEMNPQDLVNNPLGANEPRKLTSSLFGCFDGGRKMTMQPANNGGYFVTEVDPNNPSSPLGSAFIFRNDGTVQEVVPASELKYFMPGATASA